MARQILLPGQANPSPGATQVALKVMPGIREIIAAQTNDPDAIDVRRHVESATVVCRGVTYIAKDERRVRIGQRTSGCPF